MYVCECICARGEVKGSLHRGGNFMLEKQMKGTPGGGNKREKAPKTMEMFGEQPSTHRDWNAGLLVRWGVGGGSGK